MGLQLSRTRKYVQILNYYIENVNKFVVVRSEVKTFLNLESYNLDKFSFLAEKIPPVF